MMQLREGSIHYKVSCFKNISFIEDDMGWHYTTSSQDMLKCMFYYATVAYNFVVYRVSYLSPY